MFLQDVEQEHVLTKILYDMLFKEYLDIIWNSTSKIVNFEESPELQYAGVDIITVHNSQNTYIDVKCQTNAYINNPTPTFCLELSYYKENSIKEGWFVKTDQLTDYFLFVWIPNASVNDNYISEQEQLNEVECMLVKKSDIWEYLSNIGISKDGLIETAENLRHIDSSSCKYGFAEKVKLTKSDFLPEKPINLIITKNQYLKMPHTECFYYNKVHNEYFVYINQTAARQYLTACK